MLEPNEFKIKYNTDRQQIREESYLDELSEEDRELYSNVEVLTGLTPRGQFNKFRQTGFNKNKKYDTLKGRWLAHFRKYVDTKIANGDADAVFAKMWEESLDGDFRHLQYMFDRVAGKMKDEVEVSGELDLSFELVAEKIFDTVEEDEDGQ